MKRLAAHILTNLMVVLLATPPLIAQQSRTPCVCKDETPQEVYCLGGQYGSCRLDDNDKCRVTCKPMPSDPLAFAAEVLSTITEEKPDLARLKEYRQEAISILKRLLAGKTKEGAYNITYDADDVGFCFPERAVALLQQAIVELEGIGPTLVRTPCTDLAKSDEPFKDNGVVVGQTKLFDERTLRLMLESAEESLRKISPIDSSKVAQATGTFQGQRVRESSLAVMSRNLFWSRWHEPLIRVGGNMKHFSTSIQRRKRLQRLLNSLSPFLGSEAADILY